MMGFIALLVSLSAGILGGAAMFSGDELLAVTYYIVSGVWGIIHVLEEIKNKL